MSEELMAGGMANRKYIPVLLGPATCDHIPFALRGTTYYRASSELRKILLRLFDREERPSPTVGPKPPLPQIIPKGFS